MRRSTKLPFTLCRVPSFYDGDRGTRLLNVYRYSGTANCIDCDYGLWDGDDGAFDRLARGTVMTVKT